MKTNLAPMLTGKGSDLIFKSPQLAHFDAVLVKKEQSHGVGEVPSIFDALRVCVATMEAGWRKAFAHNESRIRAIGLPTVRCCGPNADDAETCTVECCRHPICIPATQLSPNCE